MTFTTELWQAIESISQGLLAHPFNAELAAGTLPLDKFQHYLQQDELYLQDYARALGVLAAKAPATDIRTDLLNYARDGIAIEQNLHNYFFVQFHLTSASERQPTCLAYASFLLATAALEPFESGLAAILPCFWIYREVGQAIARQSHAGNPFQLWIDTYSDAQYSSVVDRMIEITDRVAGAASGTIRLQMEQRFIEAARLEYAFCDAAYRQEKWPHLAF
ncbi:TenA family protein [candidate division KSB1 bacterium]|nr:TenA family protein [candidate division KSB1 bacterium]RQW01509.1 MAG: thiaminase II [candidate division KSB1 bacterium]